MALRYLTAGESHGPALCAIAEGFPAGLSLDLSRVDAELARRQKGYGRGGRMQIETDRAEFLSGIRGGVTLGTPIALVVWNKDHENWKELMSPAARGGPRFTRPRPGHADLAGGLKYLRRDLRDILERASARESAARVAAGAFAKMLLAELGVALASGVRWLGPVGADLPVPSWAEVSAVDDSSPLRAIRRDLEPAMVALVDEARASGDTLGGAVTVIAHGVPAGLGSHVAWDEKLDGRIAQALLSIPAVKGLEIGAALGACRGLGSVAHDAIERDPAGGFRRPTNRAGGLEGGITNGEDVVVTLFKKPISTLRDGLPSVDLDTLEPAASQYERSDVTALPAAGVIGEAMLALVLADAALEKYGGDSMAELRAHFEASRALERAWPARG
jgi:chorismate synthase